jgi:hypothetical protein
MASEGAAGREGRSVEGVERAPANVIQVRVTKAP